MAALEDVGIVELARQFPSSLSGGEQQRGAIARALVGTRHLLVADEPTGALDAMSAEVVAIGVIVKIRRFNANKRLIGDAEEFFVDGHYHLDHEHGIRCAGYYAPLIEKLFELPVSTYTTMVDVEIGQTKFISLLEIRLPEASQVMDTVAA